MLIWLSFALAELPVPNYRDTLAEAAGAEVVRIREREGAEAAEAAGRRWMKTMGESPRVLYEIGLGYRLSGEEERSLALLDQAVELDPTFAAARYDRGEVRLLAGDLEGAEADFLAVVAAQPTAWPGWFRLSDVSARRGDASAFEKRLLTAFRYGFSASMVATDPTWRGFLADERIGPVLRRLVGVYQGQPTLDQFRAPAAP